MLNRLEGGLLRLRTDPAFKEESIPLTYIGDMVLRSSPAIEEVIAHDIRQYRGYDAHHDVPDEELDIYAEGIHEGYNFFIGCMAWTVMVRQNESDIAAFVRNNVGSSVIPYIGRAQLAKIKQVRSGAAIIGEGTDDGRVESSKDLSFVDAGEYCFISESFEDALVIYTDELTDFPDKEEDPFVAGVLHGVANAIEMYMQLHEESALANTGLGE